MSLAPSAAVRHSCGAVATLSSLLGCALASRLPSSPGGLGGRNPQATSPAPAAAAPGGVGATTHRVRFADVQGSLGNMTCLEDDPLEKEKVEYLTCGKANYDEVSKTAAEIEAGMVLSSAFAAALTTDLKSFARSFAASKQTDKNVKEILGESKPEEITEKQALALLELKKKKGKLTAAELAFVRNAVIDTANVVSYLRAAVERAILLVRTVPALVPSLETDFAGREALQLPLVLRSMLKSSKNMKHAVSKAPDLARALSRLARGLGSLQ